MTIPFDVEVSDKDIQTWIDDNLNSQLLGFFVYGFYTGLFGISIWQLLAARKISKARIYMGCIITALYIFSLINIIATWIHLRRAHVFTASVRARYDLWVSSLWEIMAVTAAALNLVIADCTIIWRCWVVWAHNWRVIILPIFFVIGEIVCGVNGIAHQSMLEGEADETQTIWALATMATTLGTNVLCTALIVGRIIYVARGHRGIMGGIRTYRGVIEILVESAALYSIIYVVLMIFFPLHGFNAYMYLGVVLPLP